MTQSPLESLQADFVAALFDTRLAEKVAPVWSGGERVAERLALYCQNIFAAWEKSLSHSFPVVHAIVGAEFFHFLARDYGHAHPSMTGDLNRFGDTFAEFIRDHERTRSLPYLSDVAALEWSVHRAYFAADVTTLSPAHLATHSPQEFLAARFSLHPACTWISSKYPIARIWLAHQPHARVILPDELDQSELALIYRSNWQPYVSLSNSGEIAALTQLRAGANIETAIRSALDVEPRYDSENALVRWLQFDMLVEPAHAPV